MVPSPSCLHRAGQARCPAPFIPEFPKPADGPGCRSPVWATTLGVDPRGVQSPGLWWVGSGPWLEMQRMELRPRGWRGAQGVDGACRGTRNMAAGLGAPGTPLARVSTRRPFLRALPARSRQSWWETPPGQRMRKPGELASQLVPETDRSGGTPSLPKADLGAPDRRLLCAKAARTAGVGILPAPSLPGPDYTTPPQAESAPSGLARAPVGQGAGAAGEGASRAHHPPGFPGPGCHVKGRPTSQELWFQGPHILHLRDPIQSGSESKAMGRPAFRPASSRLPARKEAD